MRAWVLRVARADEVARPLHSEAGLRSIELQMAPPRVLIVDDEPLIRWCLAESLSMQGCDVLEAATVAEARKGLRQGVAVVVLDVKLPDGDGIALLEELRSSGSPYAGVPVIIMTAHGDSRVAAAARTAGAQDYVAKPFDVAALTARAIELACAAE